MSLDVDPSSSPADAGRAHPRPWLRAHVGARQYPQIARIEDRARRPGEGGVRLPIRPPSKSRKSCRLPQRFNILLKILANSFLRWMWVDGCC
ncbi:MAG: hypothetical protein WCJ64_14480 [Rhodospirillaceae bacterium]